jgi:hypothetical protein
MLALIDDSRVLFMSAPSDFGEVSMGDTPAAGADWAPAILEIMSGKRSHRLNELLAFRLFRQQRFIPAKMLSQSPIQPGIKYKVGTDKRLGFFAYVFQQLGAKS